MAKKPTIDLSELEEYRNALQTEYDELEEKCGENPTNAQQEKIDALNDRIQLVENAIEAMEAVE